MSETLQEKVDRLELYVDLLRQIAVNPEENVIWDWVISKGLNREQYNNLNSVLKENTRILLKQKEGGNPTVLSFQEFSSQVIGALGLNDDEVGKKAVAQVLRSAVRMPAFAILNHYVNLIDK
ncbi:hypothetical protein [Paenibacillus sp. 23TSA30-6]|uniref:hypothetical protein n=1 Tax=Paenibacillus sp. 23TSA30-6 TaxID=2546104 RepID=UPI001787A65A|nr:hypothetical protein [Paenibacillus sp. 23TSA30-6]MBE0335275.1 hypothetical protein [Paenibacillus sp. 23TSA30-6]